MTPHVSCLEAKIQAATDEADVTVDDTLDTDLKEVMSAGNAMVQSRHPPGSF